MTVPEARLDPRLRRYRMRRHRLHCAGGTLSVVAPARADDLLLGDGAMECLRRRQMPYWADIWPASVGLARWLMRGPTLAGHRVMDLGCGVGIAGLAAATRGARVHFADLAPDALRFAAFNCRHLPPDAVSFEQLDWSKQTIGRSFDSILLADVTYEERNFAPLRRHLQRCLAPLGCGWSADPYRPAASHFLDWLQPEFTVDTAVLDTTFDGERFALRLATIRRRAEPPAA